MESNESSPPQQQPQVHSVVIITLPPVDNPSKGKTIQAYTFTDEEDNNRNQNDNVSTQTQSQLRLSLSTLFNTTPRKLLTFLGISLFALILYNYAFSYTIVQNTLRTNSNNDDNDNDNDNDDEGPTSFIFPLYHKFGIQEIPLKDFELKLGRFIDIHLKEETLVLDKKVNKVALTDPASFTSSSVAFPVRGNVYPDGLYFTVMQMGNPRKPYFLDIDTGSDLTWIQCDAPCSSCAKGANPLYKPNRGNIVAFEDSLCNEVQKDQGEKENCDTCQQCDYEIEYADESSSMGVLARDSVHVTATNGSLTKLNVIFGCAYDQQGSLLNTLTKTDGILGLSRAKVSLPSQLTSLGIIKNVVGHCLTTEATGSGYLFFGDEYVPQWGMAWAPMLNNPSKNLYHGKIVKMSYGSSQLSLGGQVNRAVFDTGSSYTYFPKEAYDELIASLKENSGMELIQDASDSVLPICWKAKFPISSVLDVKQNFKTLTFHFGSKWWITSTKFQIPPERYLVISKKGNVCLGILDGSKVLDGSAFILGDISLRGLLVVYDNVNHRIGWGKSDCVKPNRFKSLPFLEG
ncbi:hypothetical protein ACFE04_005332 [Oxalis oulophora]